MEAALDRAIGLDRVLMLVASAYDLPYRDVAFRRSKKSSIPRAVAVYLAHTVLSMSFSKLGAALDRHPTTVLYAVRRIEALRDDDFKTDQTLTWLESTLRTALETGQ